MIGWELMGDMNGMYPRNVLNCPGNQMTVAPQLSVSNQLQQIHSGFSLVVGAGGSPPPLPKNRTPPPTTKAETPHIRSPNSFVFLLFPPHPSVADPGRTPRLNNNHYYISQFSKMGKFSTTERISRLGNNIIIETFPIGK